MLPKGSLPEKEEVDADLRTAARCVCTVLGFGDCLLAECIVVELLLSWKIS